MVFPSLCKNAIFASNQQSNISPFSRISIANSIFAIVPMDQSLNSLLTLTKGRLEAASELKYFLDDLFSIAAQYDRPPRYPVDVVCKGIDTAPEGSDVLDKIFSGMVAFFGKETCYNLDAFFSEETLDGWNWQTCSELVIPIGCGSNDTMFPAEPFDLKQYIEDCNSTFGVSPRPHWITTYYGGHHFKEVLRRFGSNIIFSNGLRDPYSSGGVLKNISESIVAVQTTKGSHCLDILPAKEDDPDWLVLQRNTEIEIIEGWSEVLYEELFENSSQIAELFH